MLGKMTLPVHQSRPRLMRRRTPPTLPVTPRSISLFRLGEACNNHCPMCSNSGRPEAWLTPQEELLKRVDWLAAQGMKRVVVTGGEPTTVAPALTRSRIFASKPGVIVATCGRTIRR